MTSPFDFLNAVSALEKPDGVIAFPTDTVYGLGCLPSSTPAIEKIYRIKGRSQQKPLILMSHSSQALEPFLGEMTLEQAHRFQDLVKAHWPGALTLVVPKSDKVPPAMTMGFDTVGMRIPQSPFLAELFEMIPGGVLATTSANISNQPECLKAHEVMTQLGSQLDYLLMEDALPQGHPSTVAVIEQDGRVSVLRQGRVVLD